MSQRSLPKPQIVLCPLSQNKRQQHAVWPSFSASWPEKNGCSTFQDEPLKVAAVGQEKIERNNHIRVWLFWSFFDFNISFYQSHSWGIILWETSALFVCLKETIYQTGRKPYLWCQSTNFSTTGMLQTNGMQHTSITYHNWSLIAKSIVSTVASTTKLQYDWYTRGSPRVLGNIFCNGISFARDPRIKSVCAMYTC